MMDLSPNYNQQFTNQPVQQQFPSQTNQPSYMVPPQVQQQQTPQQFVPPTQNPQFLTHQPTNQSPPPETLDSYFYVAGFLTTQLGKLMRVEFLIGSDYLNDRVGTLVGVGASYILLEAIDTRTTIMCDLYSIKFVTIYSPGDITANV